MIFTLDFWPAYLIGLAFLAIFMSGIWLVSLYIKDASIIDFVWGVAFILVGWVYFALVSDVTTSARGWLIMSLMTVWGLRLSWHIFARNLGKGEDFRYAQWRAEAGPPWWWQSYFKVFLLQGVLVWIISLPMLMVHLYRSGPALIWLDAFGAAVWAVGFVFEAVGDWQLARFKADPANKGKLMDRGLWRYTRHPNYFGDAAQWWGFFLIAAATPNGWLTIISPILMTVLLVRVSGVAMLERTLKHRPGYADYAARTSAFIPWFPRNRPSDDGDTSAS